MLPILLNPEWKEIGMKFAEQIKGEPVLQWYWAVALLIPIGMVVVGATFAVLLLCDSGSPSLPPEAKTPVIAAFTISAGVSFVIWRWTLRRLLIKARHRNHRTVSEYKPGQP